MKCYAPIQSEHIKQSQAMGRSVYVSSFRDLPAICLAEEPSKSTVRTYSRNDDSDNFQVGKINLYSSSHSRLRPRIAAQREQRGFIADAPVRIDRYQVLEKG